MKQRTIVAVIMLVTLFAAGRADADENDPNDHLWIHLPRNANIDGDVISLGQISIMRGEQSRIEKAGAIRLGKITVPGQKVTINRATILSRLACSGIRPSACRLTGANEVSVTQQREIIKSEELVQIARNFVEQNVVAGSVCNLTPVRKPQDLVLSQDCTGAKLHPVLAARQPNVIKVRIMKSCAGEHSRAGEVVFRLKHKCKKAIAQTDIPAGATVTQENAIIKQTISDYPTDNWTSPYGFVTRYPVRAGAEIRPNMIVAPKAPLVVKRRQTVVIRLKTPGLLITAMGQTMEQGRVGEQIKVRNVDSNRIVLVKVNEDGTVEPVL